MKKILALLLTAVMCFTLVACGDGETPDTNNGTENAEKPETNHRLLQFIYGEWEYEGNYKDNYPFAKLTVNEDGTCIVDGAAGVWRISDRTSPEGRLYIDVIVNDQVIGSAEISLWAGNYLFYVSDIMISPGDNWKHNTAVAVDDNDITLTTENWRNYFELITESSCSENAFGDVEQLTIKQYLVPKEEYAAKMLATDVIYEIQETASEYFISLNPEEKTYQLGEKVKTGEPSTPEIGKLWRDYETNRYEIWVTNGTIDAKDNADPDTTSNKTVWLVADIENINMLRIQGNLYIVND